MRNQIAVGQQGAMPRRVSLCSSSDLTLTGGVAPEGGGLLAGHGAQVAIDPYPDEVFSETTTPMIVIRQVMEPESVACAEM